MSIEIMLLSAIMIIGFVGLGGLIFVLLTKQKQQPQNLEDVVNQVFGLSIDKITQQSKQALEKDRDAISVNLENKQKAIEKLVKNLEEDLKQRQQEIRTLEQDRVKKFGELSAQIESHRDVTKELYVSTQQLSKVLSNNQQRGEWGERIIEDLLLSNGLVEGVHYLRQTKQGDGRPDITLLLPNERNVPVDVKFPYSEIQKMSVAETKKAKEGHLKQFSRDLKTKIKKVASYINPEENTLDYAILFVPNEMVFSFINQKFPDIIDQALQERVIIVSPFTFIVVARTVRESYRNFMMEDKLREVIKHVDAFTAEWGKFRDQFEKYGRSIDTLKTAYQDLTGTRVRQMERRIEKIESFQQGSLIEGNLDSD